MVYPWTIDSQYFDILFRCDPRSRYYEGTDIDSEYFMRYGEPEIVLYHKPGLPKCLGIQGHPEMMRDDAPIVNKCNELVKQLINN